MNELIERAKQLLGFRQQSYQQVFNPENRFSAEVLKDLAKFCRANETCFHPDARVQAELEGRREVWLRICHHTKLSSDDLWKLYGGK